MEIKDIIRKRREELNLTYEQLGDMVGVGKSTVRKWETGMIENMRRDNIVSLAKALKISPTVIMGWDYLDETEVKKNALSFKEETLLSSFNKLNDLGKDEAIKRVDELTHINKYTAEIHNQNNEVHSQITSLKEAKEYLKSFAAAAYGGFNPNTMSDEEIIETANELKYQFEVVSHKYKK